MRFSALKYSMEWNGIFGMKRRIDNQHFVKNAVLQYSNWNGMEWNKRMRLFR